MIGWMLTYILAGTIFECVIIWRFAFDDDAPWPGWPKMIKGCLSVVTIWPYYCFRALLRKESDAKP